MLRYSATVFVWTCLRINSRSILWPHRQQPAVCKRVNDLKPPEIKMVKDFQPQDHHKNCLIHVSLSPCDGRTLSACCSPACTVPTSRDVCSALPHSYPASYCCLNCHLSPYLEPSSCHPTDAASKPMVAALPRCPGHATVLYLLALLLWICLPSTPLPPRGGWGISPFC